MRHYVIVLCTALFLLSACGGSAPSVRTTWPDGSPQTSGSLRSGMQTGEWSYFRRNGSLEARGTFDQDKPHGLWQGWHSDDSLHYHGNYAMGLRHGWWEYRREMDLPQTQGAFAADRAVGPWQFFNASGGLEQRGLFVRGRRNGVWLWYDHQGQVTKVGCYRDHRPIGPWLERNAEGTWSRYDEPLAEVAIEEAEDVNGLPRFRRWRFNSGGSMTVRWHSNGLPEVAMVSPAINAVGHELDPRSGNLLVMDRDQATPAKLWQLFDDNGVYQAGAMGHDGAALTLLIANDKGRLALGRPWFEIQGEPVAMPVPDPLLPSPALAAEMVEAVSRQLDAHRAPIKPSPVVEPSTELAQPLSDTPIHRPPRWWTQLEERRVEAIAQRYRDGTVPRVSGADKYADSSSTTKLTNFPDQRPNLTGKPLPVARFLTSNGSVLDLNRRDHRGPTMIVIMRGFAGQVCVYCSQQTRVLGEMQQQFKDKNCEIIFVYPGAASSVPLFLDAIKTLGEFPERMPPIGLDADLALVRALDIEDELAKPTVVIVDSQGLVRYTYVGRDLADRPSGEHLLGVLSELNTSP